jgi:GAF domain-containing protein
MADPSVQSDFLSHWGDAERLADLRAYSIVDSPPEQEFDDLARIAAHVCATPIALVNFLTEDRQWFKAEIGFGMREIPLELAFCAHAEHQPQLFVVPDATQDARFCRNPLVTGEPHLRFYAGALILSPRGSPVGSLCVFDYAPRFGITIDQGEILIALARQGSILLEHRLAMRQLAEQEAKLRAECRPPPDGASKA